MQPSLLQNTITNLLERVRRDAQKSQFHNSDILVLAVSKTRSADEVRAAHACGLCDFGENYLQEALEKMAALEDLPLNWHFIGPIQSNKTRAIAEHFDWVHSVDREKIARRLSEQRPAHLPPLNICLQVNVSGEASKSGVPEAQLPALLGEVAQLPRLRLRGLMAIPAATQDIPAQHRAFARLRTLLEEGRGIAPQMDTLSMGMSGDMDAAIAEGATIVRIGTAIFGPRGG
ncbi:MAG: YggS family pyridoxal phosphate-dependent enzyme [Halioglobus sp.]|nr:YggS family pyridoxal phosphate-dependent enzyme [Halioglobus sp.]